MYQPLAEKMFILYVNNYSKLYGEHAIGSNVHNLLHVVEDLKQNNIGNLMEISTYKFENCLQLLGLNLKNCYLLLEQISRRTIEAQNLIDFDIDSVNQRFTPTVSYENACINITAVHEFTQENSKIYDKIEIAPDVELSNRKIGDSWFLSKSNEIVKMKYVIKEGSEFKIVGQYVKQKESFFAKPISSEKLKIYLSNGACSDELRLYQLSSIAAKMICLPHDEGSVFMPLLHSMENLNKVYSHA